MADKRKATILLVDDDPSNLNLLVDQLFEQEFGLMVAKSGESALERVKVYSPDMILLDVRMPRGIDGFETCRRLKADPDTRDIPVIFLSALTDVDDREHGLRVGGVDYITKPLEISEVLLRIRTHLTLRHLQLALAENNANLEAQVAARTAQLTEEIERRTHSESQQGILLEFVRSQGSQLQLLTKQLLNIRLNQRKELEQELNDVMPNLDFVRQRVTGLTGKIDDEQLLAELDELTQPLQQIQARLRQMTESLQKPLLEETVLEANPLLRLSDREREVLLLIANHYTTDNIANLLHLSNATVRTYRYRISQKLGVNDDEELLALALKYLV